jgi:DNA polymerase-3 subunit epsilon
MDHHTFAFVDIETTGGSAERNRIIEIGILRVEAGKVVERFETLVNPERYLSHEIQVMTGINPAELESAPTFDMIAQKVEELLSGAIFVAHNARFDYSFIKKEFARQGKDFRAKCLCTVKLSRLLYPRYKHHDLSSVIERFGFQCERRHRAFDDAKVLFDFMNLSEKKIGQQKLEAAISAVLKTVSRAPHIKSEVFDTLPEGPGVYTFSNEAGESIYIGKSVNIRNRVLSHFSNDLNDDKEMKLALQSSRIDCIETSGELGALLLESKMIKEHQPLYNRMLRRMKRLTLLRKRIDPEGFFTVGREVLLPEEIENFSTILGIFRSERQLRECLEQAVREHGLCRKRIGLEKGNGPCFYHQLEKCGGACITLETAESYNKKFDEAFEKRKVRVWPFSGPVVIDERNQSGEHEYSGHAYVVDQWCLLKSYSYTEDSTNEGEKSIAGNFLFDYDAYKLLSRYLLDPKNSKNIRLLEKNPHMPEMQEYALEIN